MRLLPKFVAGFKRQRTKEIVRVLDVSECLLKMKD